MSDKVAMGSRMCPNCTQPVGSHTESGCVLAALVTILKDRAEHTEERLQQIHAECDVDSLWTRLGPIIDDLGAGELSVT